MPSNSKIKESIINNNQKELINNIKENHKLLDKIGIVPSNISKFIKEIELFNGGAKISGAGAIRGNNAGIIFAICKEKYLNKICKKYNYTYKKVIIEPKGAYFV